MSANPISINLDPEFQKLNPGLDLIGREAAATVLSLSESSDVMQTLTSYIAQDKDAMDVDQRQGRPVGHEDQPELQEDHAAHRRVAAARRLRRRRPTHECYQQNPAPYFTQIAAPVTSLRKIAEAVLDAWPNVQTKCDRSTATDPWKIGRVDRQGVGSRFMLGIVSVGDARRLGLPRPASRPPDGPMSGPPTRR